MYYWVIYISRYNYMLIYIYIYNIGKVLIDNRYESFKLLWFVIAIKLSIVSFRFQVKRGYYRFYTDMCFFIRLCTLWGKNG